MLNKNTNKRKEDGLMIIDEREVQRSLSRTEGPTTSTNPIAVLPQTYPNQSKLS